MINKRATWDVDLGSDLHAARRGRVAVRQRLLRWQLPGLVDRVVLVVSELATNAVRHGTPPAHLTRRRQPDQLHVEVHDDEPTPPPLPTDAGDTADVDDGQEHGRGLIIVSSVADDLRCEQIPGDGKTMIVTFAVHHDDSHHPH